MGLRRKSLVLHILLIFYLQHNLPSVNSRSSSVDASYESLPLRATKPNVVGFEGKGQELGGGGWRSGGNGTGVGGGGGLHGLLGWHGGTRIGRGRGLRSWFGSGIGGRLGGSGGGRLRGWLRDRIGGGGGGGLPGSGGGGGNVIGKVVPLVPVMQTGRGGTGGSKRSSSNRNIQGGVNTVCWLSLLVSAGLLLV